MESSPTSTATKFTNECSLPHQQFASRIAFVGKSRKTHVSSTQKKIHLPPISKRHNLTKSAEIIETNSPNGSIDSYEEIFNNTDENSRVKQLERNISFIKEHCQQMLKCLHIELEDLKVKNRDLQFQLITGKYGHQFEAINKELIINSGIKDSMPQQMREYVNKSEKEIKRLRYALNETIKMNASLQNELRKLRKKESKEGNGINSLSGNSSLVISPPIGDFFETLQAIYRETNKKSVYLPRITNQCK